ncbi:MAG: glutamine-hydrolyzing carbamoyl-phosphate synthase small subunit [Methylococcales bacterium]|nr:glutamine-hydrolyzing carbamoyl-phosphate synthase small subunit [Methylococcales bacterium]
MTQQAILALEDGTVFHGISIGAEGYASGEAVFNTALTGYQEILTDPSYARQIVTLTYPHIGNVGVNDEDEESSGIHASGLVVRDLPDQFSNWRSQGSLREYLVERGIQGIAEIDTRKLTRVLREKGAQGACLMAGPKIDREQAIDLAAGFPGLQGMDLARVVTVDHSYEWSVGRWNLNGGYSSGSNSGFHVVAYDFGVKRNILRLLADRGCRITVVPATTRSEDVLAQQPDGVFLSNGPGDPEPCDYAITSIREVLARRVPVFGICLGHQLLALASGAKTVKMKFGHHGANHPVLELASGRVMISSQNHGFAVDEQSLPANLKPTHRSLFDDSLQGIERTDCPAMGFQGHPEASPGPHDVDPLFDRFINMMTQHQG